MTLLAICAPLKWFRLTWRVSKGPRFVNRSFQVVWHQTPESLRLKSWLRSCRTCFCWLTTEGNREKLGVKLALSLRSELETIFRSIKKPTIRRTVGLLRSSICAIRLRSQSCNVLRSIVEGILYWAGAATLIWIGTSGEQWNPLWEPDKTNPKQAHKSRVMRSRDDLFSNLIIQVTIDHGRETARPALARIHHFLWLEKWQHPETEYILVKLGQISVGGTALLYISAPLCVFRLTRTWNDSPGEALTLFKWLRDEMAFFSVRLWVSAFSVVLQLLSH